MIKSFNPLYIVIKLIIVLFVAVLVSCSTSDPFESCQGYVYMLTSEKDSQSKIEAFFPANYRIEHEESPTKNLNEKLVGYPSLDELYPEINIAVIEGIGPSRTFDTISENVTFRKTVISINQSETGNALGCIFQKTHPNKNYHISISVIIPFSEDEDPDDIDLCLYESIVQNTKFLD